MYYQDSTVYFYDSSAEEESAAKAKTEKERKLLEVQLAEIQEDLDSEKEGRLKVEKARRILEEELESLRQMLDESEGATAAQHEIRAKREQELNDLKRTLEEEASTHEANLSAAKQKHSQAVQELNDQIDILKKVVRATCICLCREIWCIQPPVVL